jgi:hypothetical protein
MSPTSAIMKYTILLFLFLSAIVQQLAAGQTILPAYCTDGTAYHEYFQCIYSNLNTCNNCDDAEKVYVNNTDISTCGNLTDYACPFFRCCSACETKAEQYYECEIFPTDTLVKQELQSCVFDCSAFSYQDNNNGAAAPCEAEIGSWLLCIFNGNDACAGCPVNDDQLSFTGSSSNCAAEQQEFCLFFDCCPSCQSEWTAAYQCDIKTGISTFASSCQLSCNGVEINTSNGGFKNGKGTNAGTKINSGATKYIAILSFLLSILS